MSYRIAKWPSQVYWTVNPEGDIIEGEFTVVSSPSWMNDAEWVLERLLGERAKFYIEENNPPHPTD